jgi:hypothetical protein
VNPPFFISGRTVDINRRDFSLLINSLLGDRKDTLFWFIRFFGFRAFSFIYPTFFVFKTTTIR